MIIYYIRLISIFTRDADSRIPDKHYLLHHELDDTYITPEFKIFLSKCLHKDPLKRPTVDDLLENDEFVCQKIPWVSERLIWIGFLKNNDNQLCLLKYLPKDIVKYILYNLL